MGCVCSLSIQILIGIVGCIPPRQDASANSTVWDQSFDGRFTVRTTYMVQEEGEAMNRDPMWKIIWKWKEIKRIRVFLWIVAHNVVMTNDKRWRRRISDNRCLLSFCVMKWKL